MNAEEGAGKERGEGDVGEREEEGRKGHGRKGMRRSGRRVGKVIALGEHDDQPGPNTPAEACLRRHCCGHTAQIYSSVYCALNSSVNCAARCAPRTCYIWRRLSSGSGCICSESGCGRAPTVRSRQTRSAGTNDGPTLVVFCIPHPVSPLLAPTTLPLRVNQPPVSSPQSALQLIRLSPELTRSLAFAFVLVWHPCLRSALALFSVRVSHPDRNFCRAPRSLT
eukprot:1383612-Rhodomonas_salina.5